MAAGIDMPDPLIQPDDLVLFQGDSITHAHRMPGELNDLFQMGAGYASMCAARLKADRPQDNLTFLNRGQCGNTSFDLLSRWQIDCIDLQPTVLSLLIGVNDSNTHHKATRPDHAPNDYRRYVAELLTRARDELPVIRLILLEPFALNNGGVPVEQLPDVHARAAIIRELAGQYDARFVELQQRFYEHAAKTGPGYWIYDGIHPTAAGHRLIADAWLEATECKGGIDEQIEVGR